MAWWAWTLIWTALVLFFLVVIGLLFWRLVKKFLVLADDGAKFAEQLASLADIAEAAPPARAVPAVLAPLAEVQGDYHARMRRRAERSQSRRDRRHERGKRITELDASTVEWPQEWYRR